jgi:hypothetical protein
MRVDFWPPARVERMRALFVAGKNSVEIGLVLGLSSAAVKAKLAQCRRKGLAGFPTVLPRGPASKQPGGKRRQPAPAAIVPPAEPPKPLPRGVRTLPLLPSEIAALAARAE